MFVPVRPVKMLVIARTRSIGACVFPAVKRMFMREVNHRARRARRERKVISILAPLRSLRALWSILRALSGQVYRFQLDDVLIERGIAVFEDRFQPWAQWARARIGAQLLKVIQ